MWSAESSPEDFLQSFKTNKKQCPVVIFHSTLRCTRILYSRFYSLERELFPPEIPILALHIHPCKSSTSMSPASLSLIWIFSPAEPNTEDLDHSHMHRAFINIHTNMHFLMASWSDGWWYSVFSFVPQRIFICDGQKIRKWPWYLISMHWKYSCRCRPKTKGYERKSMGQLLGSARSQWAAAQGSIITQ